jgi:hypothetical protein
MVDDDVYSITDKEYKVLENKFIKLFLIDKIWEIDL